MSDDRPVLTLAHSPDPDDAFMWWPITGKVRPNGEQVSPPPLDTGRFRYRAVPADIEVLNRRAEEQGDLDITALSFRAWASVRDRYVITATGSSMGDGFGPKVVRRRGSGVTLEDLRTGRMRVAVPGRRTTAFLVLGMVLGRAWAEREDAALEVPFERVIGTVAEEKAEAGLVIHEGQVLYEQAGLELVEDLGAWWKKETGLPLPLGCNAVRRDLDERFGPGSLAEVSRMLRRSVDYALEHRAESLEYTLPFALANAAKPGSSGAPTLERVDTYVRMYVNPWTVDLGEDGRRAVERLFAEGARAGLCEAVAVDII
jgi:1,4-dihydroxy-6-naphthoate synthase